MGNKKKGTILFMVIIIMLIVSFIGLLITKYVSNMMDYANELFKYTKAYYSSYAGIELELVKINNHPIGFQESIDKNSQTVKNNFLCFSNNCFFDVKVFAKSKVLGDDINSYKFNSCTDNIKYYKLDFGNSVIIPLFYDNSVGESPLSSKSVYRINALSEFTKISSVFTGANNKWYSIGIAQESNFTRNIIEEQAPDSSNFRVGFNDAKYYSLYNSSGENSFLIVSNTENSPGIQNICIESAGPKLPTAYVVVESLGNYADRTVLLKAYKKANLSEYLIYTIINPSGN